MKKFQQIQCHSEKLPEKAGHFNFGTQEPPALQVDHKAKKPLQKLQTFLTEQNGATLFCAETTGRRAILLELFSEINLHPETVTSWRDFLDAKVTHGICVAPLDFGLWLDLPPKFPLKNTFLTRWGIVRGESGASPPSFRASAPPSAGYR